MGEFLYKVLMDVIATVRNNNHLQQHSKIYLWLLSICCKSNERTKSSPYNICKLPCKLIKFHHHQNHCLTTMFPDSTSFAFLPVGFFQLASSSWLLPVGFFQLASSSWLLPVGFFQLASSSWLLPVGFFHLMRLCISCGLY